MATGWEAQQRVAPPLSLYVLVRFTKCWTIREGSMEITFLFSIIREAVSFMESIVCNTQHSQRKCYAEVPYNNCKRKISELAHMTEKKGKLSGGKKLFYY